MKHLRIILISGFLIAKLYGDEEKSGFDFTTARGFNLVELSGPGWYPPGKFHEADFTMLSDAGFNHVRIMLDYRLFAEGDGFRELSPGKMEEVDRGVALARKYGLHASICLFSVPGYSVHDKIQKPSLWDDIGLQEVFIDYWKGFAARYREIPADELSFNLINEPPWGLEEKIYAPLMRRAIQAIRETDNNRQIVIDGLDSGRLPVMSLADEPNILQSAHFYEPFPLTHYRANWTGTGDEFPAANSWPLPRVPRFLFGPQHPEASPLVVRGDIPEVGSISIAIGEIVLSGLSPVVISIVGENGGVSRKTLVPEESWKVVERFEGSEIARYQADATIEIPLPGNPGRRLSISVEKGDRFSFREISISDTRGTLRPTTDERIAQPEPVDFSSGKGFTTTSFYDREWIVSELHKTWSPLLEKGVPVVVQEFGVNHSLPHATANAYVKDCTAAFREAGMGWCYFSNIGKLGIMGSQRDDVKLTRLPDGRMMDTNLFKTLSHAAGE